MTETTLLDNALQRCATIHQPHALKAFLAAQNLSTLFSNLSKSTLNEKGDVWQQTASLIEKSEIQVEGNLAPRVLAQEFSEFRIKKVLSLGIYPAAYQAVFQWYKAKGFADIFEYYLSLAATHNEYLSHNVTILLAFKRLYPQLKEAQVTPFLDRLTEFITASFHDKVASSILENQPVYCFETVLEACLKQPSFFGHNLITLAWIMRAKAQISDAVMSSLTQNLYLQAIQPLDDPNDAMDETLFALTRTDDNKEQFYQHLKSMVFDPCHNLHQVTLADALYYLYQQFPQEGGRISGMADYYVRVFKG